MKIKFHPRVNADVKVIVRYYDKHSDLAGDWFLDELQQTLEKLKQAPERHHFVTATHRRLNLKRFPFHLIYDMVEDYIRVQVVRHHRRNPTFGMKRRWK